MGTNTITNSLVSPGKVVRAAQNTQYFTALNEDFVPRNSSGVATDVAGSLGNGTINWNNLSADGAITFGGLTTQGGITQTNSVGLLSSSTALPDGTTGATQTAADSSTLLATTAYVDSAVLAEDLWDRVAGTPNYVIPNTVADDIGATGARITKGWFTDLESTNAPTVGGAAVYYSGGTDVVLADGGTGIDASGATDGQLLIGGAASNDLQLVGLGGTANQVTVTTDTNSIVLSTPQDIATASNVQFGTIGVGTAPVAAQLITIDNTLATTRAVRITNTDTDGLRNTVFIDDLRQTFSLAVQNNGTSSAGGATFDNLNAASTGRALRSQCQGSGDALLTWAGTTSTGQALSALSSNTSNTAITAKIETGALGSALKAFITNTNNSSIAVDIQHAGLGKGLVVKTTNANSSTLATIEAIQSGPGPVAVLSGGDVMIGTGTPTEKLEVQGSIKSSVSGVDGSLSITNSATVETVKLDTNGDSFLNGGNVGIGGTPDDLFHVQEAVDGNSILALLENSQANAAASTNETTQIRFGFGGDNDVARIVIGKDNDYTSGANSDSFMSLYTDVNGTQVEQLRLDSTNGGQIEALTPFGAGSAPTTDTNFYGYSATDGIKAAFIQHESPTETAEAALIQHDGLGKGLIIKTTNATSSTLATLECIQSGPGPAAVLSGGDVMIGTGTPTEKLEVDGNIKSTGDIIVGTSNALTDTTGTLTLQNVDVIDATTESTIEAAIDTLANLTSVQGQGLTLSASLTVEAASNINQDVTTDANVQFTQATLGDTGLIIGTSTPFSDSTGTLTLQNIDVLDATTEGTIESAIDTLANLTSVQGQGITLSASLTVEAATNLNQDLTTDASPTFANLTLTGNPKQQVHTDDVSNPPTDAELDAIFGTPATVGTGFNVVIDDNNLDANFYHVWSNGTSWWIFTGTKAS